MRSTPDLFHFIFGLREQCEPFHIVHYLCLASCIEVNRPDEVRLYCHFEPHGPWWERIRPHLTLVRVDLESFVVDNPNYRKHAEGLFISRAGLDYAHQADFLRLRALIEHGGVYADMDTLFVNPYPRQVFAADFVMAEEDPLCDEFGVPRRSLCNAVMISRPDAAFPKLWLERMQAVFDGTWNRHSCFEAARLAEAHPEWIWIAPTRWFYKHMWTRDGLFTLLEGLDRDLDAVYSMHLWSHLWWARWRTDFTHFHAGCISEHHIRTVDTTYNIAARRFLPS